MSTYEDYKEKIDEIIKNHFIKINKINKKYKISKKDKVLIDKFKSEIIIILKKNEKNNFNYKYYNENIVKYNYINLNTKKTKNNIKNQNLEYSSLKNTNTYKKYKLLHKFLVIVFQHYIPVVYVFLEKKSHGKSKINKIKDIFNKYLEELRSIKNKINNIFENIIDINSIRSLKLDQENENKLIAKINRSKSENDEIIKYLIISDIKIFILNTYILKLYNGFKPLIKYAKNKQEIEVNFSINFKDFNKIITELQDKYNELLSNNKLNKNILNDYKKLVEQYCKGIINLIKFINNNLNFLNKDLKWYYIRFWTENSIRNIKIIKSD
tara:strand:+ start:41 stop:1015 length:975 start_codon:yes stop_codon:yes gene_type:complete